ncbi:hypothetical protein LCGC14_0451050 [marine sediment metagenome]|uniref:Uncharacterized protein n=1 Tax=marine sediment metagenome TaxID=412755 RepID=A0A0F9SN73_9ZZZZ
MNHTPGPWNVKPDCSGNDPHVYRIDDAKGQTVARDISPQDAPLLAAALDLFAALKYMNHMGGDDRGGYCICPLKDGSAPDHKHATVCKDARQAVAKAESRQKTNENV